jgi:phosphate acetyltransferase/phosphate butyryltransferase
MTESQNVKESEFIESKTFEEIKSGDSASLIRTLTMKDVNLFAAISGDIAPAYVDKEYTASNLFHAIIAHGMWSSSLISTLLATKLPGPGTVYLSDNAQFMKPVKLGDTINATITVKAKNEEKRTIIIGYECINQNREVAIKGEVEVIAPLQKLKRLREIPPEVIVHDRGAHYEQVINLTKGMKPLTMAIVHPVDQNALIGAIDAANKNLIIPVFIGPEDKILNVARTEKVDISSYKLVATQHSHESAARAVAMARNGDVEALMKGSLHTDELMHEVVNPETGLLTERRMSHVFVMDVPTYPKPLMITDAAINIYPTLDDKRDIVQNAIDLARLLGIEIPKVAVLSAVETVTSKIRSTLEAAALCKMADRLQITGGIIDGPLAFDNAISADAAAQKGIVSPVAGQADILLVPDVESGNMLAKQLEYLAEALSAGIVLGARVPIVLTSRADNAQSHMVSCALALLMARETIKKS